MARNTGSNTRVGAVKNRVQTFNEKTGQYVKRNTETGRFMSSKSTPYKGVSRDTKARKTQSNQKKH
jgi:hypothetical protein